MRNSKCSFPIEPLSIKYKLNLVFSLFNVSISFPQWDQKFFKEEALAKPSLKQTHCLLVLTPWHRAREEAPDLQVPGDMVLCIFSLFTEAKNILQTASQDQERSALGTKRSHFAAKNNPSIPQKEFLKSKKQRCLFFFFYCKSTFTVM